MTDTDKINSRLAALEQEVIFLRVAVKAISPDAVVGAEYVAALIGCAPDSVVRGRFGTDALRRVRQSPVGFVKREVDAWHRKNIKPVVSEKASEERSRARLVRRKK